MYQPEAKYLCGEIIQKGDHIKYDEENGIVDFIVTSDNPQWESYWKDLGEGVMLLLPTFGSLYVPTGDKELVFVSRG